jgi:hypothetical protein
MKNSIDYYNIKLDSVSAGRLFSVIKFPDNRMFIILYALSLLSISIITGYFIISAILLIIGLREYHSVGKTRIKILESCLVDEIMASNDLKDNGVSKEFIHDSPHITDSDRDYFFSDALYNS